MFGGDGTEALPPDPPACSRVEMQVAKSAAEALGRALEAALDPASKPDFRFDRLDVVTDKIRDRMGGLVARFAVELFGRGAALSMCLPPSVFPALKQALPSAPAEETRADPAWARLMEEGVKRAEVTLRAFLEERLTLGVIARLKVGQILPLESTPRTRARTECNGQQLFWCEIGQGEGTYTIRIDEPVDQARESGHAVPHH
jgi:flagellar motor switch protein FliM